MTLAGGIVSLVGTSCAPPAVGARGLAPGLRRGINIHHMLNWPEHQGGKASAPYVWPPFATPPYQLAAESLDEIVARGFTFVRLTVAPSIFLAAGAGQRAELVRIVMSRVDHLLAAGLEVVVDLHPVEENPAYPPELLTSENFRGTNTYAEIVKALARALGQRPGQDVALELMNEPHPAGPTGAARWQVQQAKLYAAARQEAPELALVVSGVNWSGADELTKLDLTPYRGSNVIFTFHYYRPHLFTHAGMPRSVPEYYVEGLTWPPDPTQAREILKATLARIAADPKLPPEVRASTSTQARSVLGKYFSEATDAARVNRDFAEVADWASAHNIPANRVLLGEFGVFHRANETPAARASRLTWLETIRRAAESRSFGWAVWVLQDGDKETGGIGILPPGAVSGMDSGVVHALGLKSR